MTSIGRAPSARVLAASLTIVLTATLGFATAVSATASLSPANASISADTGPAPGTASGTVVAGPVITEGAAGDIDPGGNLVLTLSGSYTFVNGTVSVAASAGSCGLTASALTVGATTASTTLGGTGTTGANRCRLTFSLTVQPTTNAVPSVGTISASFTGTAGVNGLPSTVGTLTLVPGAPSTVTFNAQPSSSNGGEAFGTQPQVHVVDRFGQDVPSVAVTLSISPGTGSAAGNLSCTTNPVTTTGTGIAQFAGCRIDVAANGYRIRATANTAFADSSLFNIAVGSKDHLVFSSYPATNTPSILVPQPAVRIVDLGGNTVASATDVVTLLMNMNDGSFTCTGGKSRAAVAGVATFGGCAESIVASGYSVTASATGLGPAVGATFNVTSGAASKLAICWGPALPCSTTPPAPITGGTAFPVQPVVRILDANNNTVVTDSTTIVTLAILSGTPASGGPGTLACTANTVTAVNGIATFAGCKIDKTGTGYRLNATSSPALTPGQSGLFNVVAGPPVKLAFIVQPPTTATAQAPFPSNIQVGIVDAGGNVATTGITASISLAIGANPGNGTLTCAGGNTATTSAGVATFPNCVINNQGVGYTLIASVAAVAPTTSIAPATSTTFNVVAPQAVITLTPSSNVIVWGRTVVFSIHFGANGGNRSFALQVSKDAATWFAISGATAITTNAAGDASFSYRPSDNRYYRVVWAGAPDLSAATSSVIRVVVRQTNALRPTHTGYQSIAHGTQIAFRSTVRPNRPELPGPVVDFVVYQLVGRTWVNVLDRLVGVNRDPASPEYGRAALFITFNTPGKFYVRSQAVPTSLNANSGWSQLVLYIVR